MVILFDMHSLITDECHRSAYHIKVHHLVQLNDVCSMFLVAKIEYCLSGLSYIDRQDVQSLDNPVKWQRNNEANIHAHNR